MNISKMEKKLAFVSRISSSAEKFCRKHKKLSFLGVIYTFISIILYNIWLQICCNSTRIISLSCLLLFFVLSSSFAYPKISAGITDSAIEVPASEEEEFINPDIAEIDGLVSGADILGDMEESVEPVEADALGTSEEVAVNFKSDDWKLILVNKQHPIPDDYKFVLGDISSGMKCDERVIKPLCDMLKAAKDDGVSLIVGSPYRDINRQTMLFDKKVKKYMNSGMSYMDAYKISSQAVTVPGSSEHQIGLAVDIITDGYITLDEVFANTPAGKWLAANCYKYGFILRYPAGKEEITSIEFEPWHFRYVGVDAATVMTKNGICLEEFWNKYVDKE